MNPPREQNNNNTGNSASGGPSRLEAFIREQHELQQTNRERQNPPTLLEALWLAESNSGDNTLPQRASAGAEHVTRQRQTMPNNNELPLSVSDATQTAGGATSAPNNRLQSMLLFLAAQRQTQLERQVQQRSHNFAVSLPPRAATTSAPLQIDESSHWQRLIAMATQSQQQEETKSPSRSDNQPLWASLSAPPAAASVRAASSSIDTPALQMLLRRNENQQSLQERNQHLGSNIQFAPLRTAIEQHQLPFSRSSVRHQGMPGVSATDADWDEGVTSGSFLASAMRQMTMLAAAQGQPRQDTLLHQEQQRLLQNQISRLSEGSSASSTGQQQEYQAHLPRQLQITSGSLNAGLPSQQSLGVSGNANQSTQHPQMAAMDAATSRFLEASTNRLATTSRAVSQIDHDKLGQALQIAHGSGSTHGATNLPKFIAANRIVPLGATKQSHFLGHSRVNSFYLPSILQGTKQESIQSDSSSEANGGRIRSKRKFEDIAKVDVDQKPAAKPSNIKHSFPMPSLKAERNVHASKFLAFHRLWDELEDSEMQDEIFRQRIYHDVTIIGNSR